MAYLGIMNDKNKKRQPKPTHCKKNFGWLRKSSTSKR